jgi:hypothetical protein
MICQHHGCDFKSTKRASITRHFKGAAAQKTHTEEELALTLASASNVDADAAATAGVDAAAVVDAADAVVDAAATADAVVEVVDAAATADAVVAVVNAAATADAVADAAAAERKPTDLGIKQVVIGDMQVKEALASLLEDQDFRARVMRDLMTEIIKQPPFCEDFGRLLMMEAASTPLTKFGHESTAMMCANDSDIRMWRVALSAETGVGLVDLIVKKHLAIFKNVRASDCEGTISVYCGSKVWKVLTVSEAAKRMLARCEHDILDLYETDDPVYMRYKNQVRTFIRNVGGKLGWDASPYGCQHEEIDERFSADLEAMISKGVVLSLMTEKKPNPSA